MVGEKQYFELTNDNKTKNNMCISFLVSLMVFQ